MTAEQQSYASPLETQSSEHAHSTSDWENAQIGSEAFMVKKDRVFPMIYKGEEVVFKVNEYHHPETGTQITVFALGMDKPTNEPAIVRADYGCPCMNFGPSFTIPSHDCGPQRDMMFETIADLGIGAIAIVSEQTAAGNGHGAHVVFDQSTKQYEARESNNTVPTMQEFYSEQGYFPFDNRRHDLVGKTLVDTVGKERLAIFAMSSQKKMQELSEAGLNSLDGLRVDLVTDTTGVHDHLLRRDNYNQKQPVKEPGAYLISNNPDGNMQSIRLIRDTYDMLFKPQPLRITPNSRLN